VEGKGQDGAATLPMEQPEQISDVQRQELLATALREDDKPASAISILTDVISIWRLYLPGVEPGISR